MTELLRAVRCATSTSSEAGHRKGCARKLGPKWHLDPYGQEPFSVHVWHISVLYLAASKAMADCE